MATGTGTDNKEIVKQIAMTGTETDKQKTLKQIAITGIDTDKIELIKFAFEQGLSANLKDFLKEATENGYPKVIMFIIDKMIENTVKDNPEFFKDALEDLKTSLEDVCKIRNQTLIKLVVNKILEIAFVEKPVVTQLLPPKRNPGYFQELMYKDRNMALNDLNNGLVSLEEINFVGPNRMNILMCLCACYAASVEGIDILVEKILQQPGVDVNYVTSSGHTALSFACFNNSEKKVQMLLDHPDINVNIINSYGQTLLMELICTSSFSKSKNIIQMLLKHPKIDLNIKSKTGMTAMDYLMEKI